MKVKLEVTIIAVGLMAVLGWNATTTRPVFPRNLFPKLETAQLRQLERGSVREQPAKSTITTASGRSFRLRGTVLRDFPATNLSRASFEDDREGPGARKSFQAPPNSKNVMTFLAFLSSL
jgi:hypothetical protein